MHQISHSKSQTLRHHRQGHVLAWWDHLSDQERRDLLQQVQSLDLAALRKLYEQRDQASSIPPPENIEEVPVILHDSPDRAVMRRTGEQALRAGEVAVLLVA